MLPQVSGPGKLKGDERRDAEPRQECEVGDPPRGLPKRHDGGASGGSFETPPK
jgi:hypothetical protein